MSTKTLEGFGAVVPNDWLPSPFRLGWRRRLKAAFRVARARRRLQEDARILAEHPPAGSEVNRWLEMLCSHIVAAVRAGTWRALPEGNCMTMALLDMSEGWALLAKTGEVDARVVAILRGTMMLDFGWYWEREVIPKLAALEEAIMGSGTLIPRFADDDYEF